MNYVIFSIDDSRKKYTDAIKAQLNESFWWQQCYSDAVNGGTVGALERARNRHPYTIKADLKRGQLGIWYTVLDSLTTWCNTSPLVTFEDDAILHSSFNDLFWRTTSHLPRDADAFSLFLPRDQDMAWPGTGDGFVCKAYQRYGGVSMMWTPKGAQKFRRLVKRDGIRAQWDDQLYEYAQAGKMKVYTQPPTSPILVGISGSEISLVQESEMYAR